MTSNLGGIGKYGIGKINSATIFNKSTGEKVLKFSVPECEEVKMTKADELIPLTFQMTQDDKNVFEETIYVSKDGYDKIKEKMKI